MKRTMKTKRVSSKRDLFTELREGMTALGVARYGKRKSRTKKETPPRRRRRAGDAISGGVDERIMKANPIHVKAAARRKLT